MKSTEEGGENTTKSTSEKNVFQTDILKLSQQFVKEIVI
jgi:hypothetical protein